MPKKLWYANYAVGAGLVATGCVLYFTDRKESYLFSGLGGLFVLAGNLPRGRQRIASLGALAVVGLVVGLLTR